MWGSGSVKKKLCKSLASFLQFLPLNSSHFLSSFSFCFLHRLLSLKTSWTWQFNTFVAVTSKASFTWKGQSSLLCCRSGKQETCINFLYSMSSSLSSMGLRGRLDPSLLFLSVYIFSKCKKSNRFLVSTLFGGFFFMACWVSAKAGAVDCEQACSGIKWN